MKKENREIIINENYSNNNNLLFTKLTENIINTENDNINNDKNDSINLFDISNSFSIKGEKEVQDLYEKNQILTEKYLPTVSYSDLETENNNNFIIAFKFNNEYLIPMELIFFSELNKKIKAKNLITNQIIEINKEKVFIQKIDSLNKIENFSKIKIINELSILYNLMLNFEEEKFYININNILISFLIDNEYLLSNFEEKFISFNRTNKFYLIKKIGKKLSLKYFKNIINILNENIYNIYYDLISNVFNLFEFFDNNCFLLINLGKNLNIKFNLISFFNNNFFNKNLLFSEEEKQRKFIKLEFLVENEIKNFYSKNKLNNAIIQAIQNLCNFNGEIINLIWKILNEINMNIIFIDIFKILLLSYLIYNYKKYINSKTININNNNNNSNIIFYSNILIINAFKYLCDTISIQLKNNKNNNNFEFDEENLNLLFIYYSTDNNLNSIIDNFIFKSINEKIGLNKILLENFNIFYSNYEKNLTNNEKILIKFFEEIVSIKFNSSIYLDFDNFNSLTELLLSNILISFKILENEENKNEKFDFIQIWYFYLENILDYNEFFRKDLSIEFVEKYKIIDYCNYYKNKFFIEMSYQNFFNNFLPILSDIDSNFNVDKNDYYDNKIKSFLNDIKNFENIDEKFEINTEKKIISIDYNIYNILFNLLLNVYNEKANLIQKNFKLFIKRKNFLNIKKKCILIQNFYRKYFYRKITNFDKENIGNYLLNKYKNKDKILIKLIFDVKNKILLLNQENKLLRKKINNNISLRKNNNNNDNNSNISINNQISNSNSIKNSKISNLTLNITNSSFNNNYNNNNFNNSSMISEYSIKNNDSKEVIILKNKLANSKKKYKDLINTAIKYQEKMDNFIKIINNKKEIKDILNKNGIKFN